MNDTRDHNAPINLGNRQMQSSQITNRAATMRAGRPTQKENLKTQILNHNPLQINEIDLDVSAYFSPPSDP